MGAVGGSALRLLGTSLYILALLCSIVILAIYSYFLAAFSTHDVHGPNWVRAIEGIGGAAVLYTLVASILTCFLAGFMVFAFIGVVLNILFVGGFIAIAIMARHGASSCTGDVRTPLGNGDANSRIGWDGASFTPTLGTACTMNKAVFAVAILGAFLFLIAAVIQLWIGRHHQREKRYGPSPANGYTKGNGIKFFRRRKGAKSAHAATAKDAEAGIIPGTATTTNGHHHHHDTVADPSYNTPAMNAYQGNKYESAQTHPHNGVPATGAHHIVPTTGSHHTVPAAGGYHTGPAGSAVNPYNYDSRTTH